MVDNVVRKVGGLEEGLTGLDQVYTPLSATTAANIGRSSSKVRDHLPRDQPLPHAIAAHARHLTRHHTRDSGAAPASIDDEGSVATNGTSLSGAPPQRNVPSYMQPTANRERSASKAARSGSRASVSSPGNGMGSSRRIQGLGDYEDEGLASLAFSFYIVTDF